MIREVVKINEDLCDGCGLCVPGCHKGTFQDCLLTLNYKP
ncbi:MAG: 4Fe-4S binding protein [Bacteroidales bacterium]|nr:4Fe-4S binding protein [Bacteroidales bacterium]